jgi:2-polyprenyl-3-methyl-5-hydroxy-6-metoxy-1,4-benzoquinol methylase
VLPFVCPTDHTAEFLDRALPTRSRILEVGCGGGDLALRLTRLGHRVVGIDPSDAAVGRARTLGVDAHQADLTAFKGDPFDVVIFTRSLHHIDPLDGALRHANELLRPEGMAILEEFAVDAMDRATATWFYDMEGLLEASGILRVDAEDARSSPGDPLRRWHAAHTHGHPLHTGPVMLEALSQTFDVKSTERVPYLYRYLIDRLEPSDRGYRAAREVFDLELRRTADHTLSAIGLRAIARRR